MISWVFRLIYRHGIQIGVVFLSLVLAITTTGRTNAYAVTYELTGGALGLSEGNYGSSLTISAELSLSALTRGGRCCYPTGVPGTIYLHQTDGTGVQNWCAKGSKEVSGGGRDAYESLIFNFSTAVDVQQVAMWIKKKFKSPGVELWVKPVSGSAIQVPATSVWNNRHMTGSEEGYVNFWEFPELSGVGSIERIIARAPKKIHFYVNRIDYELFIDNDSDGYPADNDCNDSDPNINPGATEICNGVDDNCDGNTDEGCMTYYRDADGDTYGDSADSTTATSPPSGYVDKSGDCDDTNASINPGAAEVCNGVDDNCDGSSDEGCTTYYRDADSDIYGDPGNCIIATSPPTGYVENSDDCDDTNANIYPGATEICNGVDDDCDTAIDEGCTTYYQDADSDGYGNPGVTQEATSPPSGYVPTPGDCDDNDNTVYPGASELCDGKDNDCDTQVDEGCTLSYWDGDSDGYGNPAGPTTTVPQSGYVANAGDCDDTNGAINPGATEVCNGLDDNCDGNIDEGCVTYYRDADGDTYGDPGDSTTATSPPSGYVANSDDCDDTNDEIYPGATEQCNNGVDDDCDGATDEGCVTYCEDADGDGYGNSSVTKTVASPAPPPGYVANCTDCNDNKARIHPGAPERCNNNKDDDCDGRVDEGCISGGGSVGGVALPVDKLGLLAPWIGLAVLMTAMIALVTWRKKRGTKTQ